MLRSAPPEVPQVSAVVPCFNEQDGLTELARRLSAVLVAQCGDAYEIVLVDDGSRDATWAQMLALSRENDRIVAIRLTRNHGHQKALSAGLAIATGARVLILDADLQDPPELLPRMMAMMDDGAEVVYGQRQAREGETWFKRTSARMFYRLLERMVDVQIPRDTGDFRLMSRRALDVLLSMPEQQRFIRGMVAWIGFDQRPIHYDRDPRHTGVTHYSLVRMISLALSGITSFSVMPLRIASAMGALVSVIAVLLLIHTLFSWLFLDTVSGWTSMMCVVLVLSGAQLLVLGMLGEYVGRIYVEAKRRPIFMIDTIARDGEAVSSPDLARAALQAGARP